LKVSQNHARFSHGTTSANVVMNNSLKPIQLVSCQDDPAERNSSRYRAGAGAGNSHRGLIARRVAQNLSNLCGGFRQDDALGEASANMRRVSEKGLDFVGLRFG
jgi:hypothetical protein